MTSPTATSSAVMTKPVATPRGIGASGPAVPIVRPQSVPRATTPVDIPAPEHEHLPAWVRRVYAQARPILGDLLAGINSPEREEMMLRIDALTAAISGGKFSLSWQYPELIDSAYTLFLAHRETNIERSREQRVVEATRRRILDLLREGSGRIAPDVATRLNRVASSAHEAEALSAAETEARQALQSARTGETRRREREINRTKAQIHRSARAENEPQTESWQDVLRRFSSEQLGTDGEDTPVQS